MKEDQTINIKDFEPKYSDSFYDLNAAWIEKYFSLEEKDIELLRNPQQTIIYPGGHILFAVDGNKPIGTVALIPTPLEYDFELAKMCVDPNYQKRGIGQKLTKAAIDRAKSVGASSIFLETNSILGPAIALYRKLGFKETKELCSPYQRCDLFMELIFDTEKD